MGKPEALSSRQFWHVHSCALIRRKGYRSLLIARTLRENRHTQDISKSQVLVSYEHMKVLSPRKSKTAALMVEEKRLKNVT